MDRDNLTFLLEVQRLKSVYRFIAKDNWQESAAAHSWGLAFLTMHFHSLQPTVDLEKAIQLALCHDLVEIYAGDVDWFGSGSAHDKEKKEIKAAKKLSGWMPEFYDLWQEYEHRSTEEGQFVHAIDRIEPLIAHLWLGTTYYRDREVTAQGMIEKKKDLMTEQLMPVLKHVTALAEKDGLMYNSRSALPVPESNIDLAFLLKMQELKHVERSMAVDNRYETDAEHCWGLAFLVLYFSSLQPEIDLLHTLKLALTHDLVEIVAGDANFYDTEGRKQKEQEEVETARQLFANHPEYEQLWEEFEAGETTEAQFVKALDKLEPIFLNVMTEGRNWWRDQVALSQVRDWKGPYMTQALRPVFDQLLQYAEEQGFAYHE